MTTLHTATILIVFAGGPHTPERTALACELLASQPPPAIIYLAGKEYGNEYSNLAAHVRSVAANLPSHPEVRTDSCTTTWASCQHLARALKSRYPEAGSKITVVTSNYHAPRVRWLLSSVIPSSKMTGGLEIVVSHDIPGSASFATPLNRSLVLGEWLSWTYCLPLGLIHRPFLLTLGILLLACVIVRKKINHLT
ncbi:MAG: ElyC/SanA/YdcF family protein [Deltaproteobacteria bacterium]